MMGIGATIDLYTETPAVTIEDYLFDNTTVGEVTPLATGIGIDYHDTWDLDGTDFTPEASPDDEGYWDIMPELVTNGTYDTDSNWTKGTGWTISGGTASCDGTNSALLFQSLSGTTTSDTFEVTYTISSYVSGSVFVGFGSGLVQPSGTTRNADGTYTEILTKTSVSTSFGFKSVSFVGSINNVSVTEYAITPLDV